jgi:hypothetical protein
MAFTRHRQFADKRLVDVVHFGPEHMAMVELAGRRLAAGQDPGSVPPRFMIGAARYAMDHRLASPQAITDNFYRMLGRR